MTLLFLCHHISFLIYISDTLSYEALALGNVYLTLACSPA